MNTRHEKDQLSAAHYDRKWKETINVMPQGGDYCFYMRQYGYDIILNSIRVCERVFDYACGLGVLTEQIEKKGAYVYGCDISKVAIEYIQDKLYSGHYELYDNFQVTDKFFKMPDEGERLYHTVVATYLIEHLSDPVAWLQEALTFGNRVIFSIPNNFKRQGEHELMQWYDWNSFYTLFAEFKLTRIDEGKYHPWLPAAYHHPTFICEKK